MSGPRRPFARVLVANRGEIACRIMRTAHAKGLQTVAVFSDADRDSPHVRLAQERIAIGGNRPAESYLRIDAIIDAAVRASADAIHPGYGFLAENPEFAQAVTDAGLVWIGPSAQAIRAMGNKARAKVLMRDAGVPCIPGYDGPAQDDTTLTGQAERIGYPLMIKAADGGGGRGMRLVRTRDEFSVALRDARAESIAAFGSAELILERALTDARHVEVQILGDAHGNVIHLGERDCTVQRRHQKMIEESPCPVVDETLREALGAMAVRAARAIGYVGAGTVECLLTPGGAFYFMEMNTRLQVEHAVTEAVAGIDLVACQFDVAAGDPLAIRQEDVRLCGHAIEARLIAEDVPRGFLPQTGQILHWGPPQEVRVDHALAAGLVVSPYYDSMLAKVIAHGATREEARRKLVMALRETVLLGVPTNQPFLVQCLHHPDFVAGSLDTGFVDRVRANDGACGLAPGATTIARAAVAALGLCETICHRDDRERRLPALDSHVRLRRDSACWDVWIRFGRGHGDRPSARIREVCGTTIGTEQVVMPEFDQDRNVFARQDCAIEIFDVGRAWRFEIDDPRLERARPGAGGDIRAPLSGRVTAVIAAQGEAVREGQRLLVIEAMKMEHVVAAPIDGVVGMIAVKPGDQVRVGTLLATVIAAV